MKELLIGYSVPFLFVSLTGLVEAVGPHCSPYTPRFVEEVCWYGGTYHFRKDSK